MSFPLARFSVWKDAGWSRHKRVSGGDHMEGKGDQKMQEPLKAGVKGEVLQ